MTTNRERASSLHAMFRNCQSGGRRGGPHPDSTFIAIAEDAFADAENAMRERCMKVAINVGDYADGPTMAKYMKELE